MTLDKREVPQPLVEIWGESHFHRDEVQRIRLEVLSFNPDTILLESKWEARYYRKALSRVETVWIDKRVSKDLPLPKQFSIREENMLRLMDKHYTRERVAIVVGDTHLRTIATPELGRVSPIAQWAHNNGVTTHRSLYPEIK